MNQLQINNPTIINGFDYSTVQGRVKAFHSDHQDGQILTEIVSNNKDTGEVIFKAHAVIDGVIKATSHAMEIKGTSNINMTSHIECAETTAIARALAMCGYMQKTQLESFEELENARLQREEIAKKEKMLKTNIARLSIKFKKAIDLKDDKGIQEVQTELRKAYDKEDSLRKGVNATLSDKQVEYLVERQQLMSEQRRIERDRRESVISKRANRLREKELFG
ncbi:hypothetical protein [Candidatus Pseudothioglobus sp. Uisw_086]|uniref:hypothetical protein n=1 Tax=Candidatus Pseudothioglobus sp. Uisw_086 TaxID=3230998 RepID=UPI003A88631D